MMACEKTPLFRGFYFDETRGLVVHVSGKFVYLRAQTVKVFRILAKNPNVVIDRKHFEDTVWKDSIVTSDSLTQCIFEIRKILGDTKRKTLVTIPKVGYVLWADAEENSNVEPLFGREPARSRQHSPQYGQRIPGNDKSLDLPVSAKLISLR